MQTPTLLTWAVRTTRCWILNLRAYDALQTTKSLEIIPGANHLFDADEAMDMVSMFATRWFSHYLA